MSVNLNIAIASPISWQPASNQNNQCQVSNEHFDTAAEAIGSLPGNIVMFGYTHRSTPGHRSAVRLFAEEILPQMAREDFHELVLEIFPHGEPGDQIEIELAEFNRTGRIGREMYRFIRVTDRPYFELLLNEAYRLGITIYSGGVDYGNVEETVLHPSFGSSPARIQTAINEINRNSGQAISRLAGNRKKVFSFNGCLHNNLRPDQASSGFGAAVDRLFHGRTVEVDIVIPELSRRNKSFRDLALGQACNWESYIPRDGVQLVESSSQSFLLFIYGN